MTMMFQRPPSPHEAYASSRRSSLASDGGSLSDDVLSDSSDDEYGSDPSDSSSSSCSRSVESIMTSLSGLPPHQKKLITLVCVLLVTVTGLNVASVGYALQRQERRTTSIADMSYQGGAEEPHLVTYNNIRGQAKELVDTDGGKEERDESQQEQEHAFPPYDPQDAPVGNGVQQIIEEQAALIASVREQVQQQNDLIDMMKRQKTQQQQVATAPVSVATDSGSVEAASASAATAAAVMTTADATESDAPAMPVVTDEIPMQDPPMEDTAPSAATTIADAAEGDAPVRPVVTDEIPTQDPPMELTVSVTEPELAGYKDAWDAHEETDIPVLWHIPRAGGSTIKQMLQGCHRMTLAAEAGIADGHDQDAEIAVVHIGGDPAINEEGWPFVNVDTTSRDGLARAGRLGLAQSGLANVMATPFIYDADAIFDPEHKGRLFAIIRDPIDRAVSTFANLQVANPELAGISLDEYAQSPHVENNWMTRYLSNQMEGELSEAHLQVAMDVARRKLLVGLRHQFVESIERFEKFFLWRFDADPENQEYCRSAILTNTGANAKDLPYPEGLTYDLLSAQNQLDIQLYQYLQNLFVEQEALVHGFPDRFGQVSQQQSLPDQPYQENQPSQEGGALVNPLTGQPYTPIADIPPYVCEDRHPEGFTDEPLPNPFPLLCGATRPCYDNFANFPSEPNPKDVPAFWHVPKAGGSTIKDIVGHCMGRTQADEVGVRNGHDADTTLQVVEEESNYFVNVDTSQPEGMWKARELGLAPSGLADLVTIVNIQDADYVFDQEHKGRFFSLFRHPVERAISMFYYLSKADWEPTYRPEYADMTLLEYTSRGGPVENNFMVRFLVNQRRGPVGEEQLEFAKQVLREKFVVGLLHETKESWRRFQQYFDFKPVPGMDEAAVNECIQGYLGGGSNQNAGKKTKMDELDPTSEVSRKLHSQNDMDIKLYEYAVELFEGPQAEFFAER